MRATAKQLSFIERLTSERDHATIYTDNFELRAYLSGQGDELSAEQASGLISSLLACPEIEIDPEALAEARDRYLAGAAKAKEACRLAANKRARARRAHLKAQKTQEEA